MINLDGRQSGQANNSTSNVKCAKERGFAIVKCCRKLSKRPNRNAVIIKRV